MTRLTAFLRHCTAAVKSWPAALRMKRFLLLSFALMVAGHVAVIAGGAVFDERTGSGYDLAERWVSDYAARWPEGLLVKTSIVLFCAVLWEVFRSVLSGASGWRRQAWRACLWMLLGGMVLVAVFDMSPQAYEFRRSNWLFRFFGHAGSYEAVPRSGWEWMMRTQHQWGFRLFVLGFFLACAGLMVRCLRRQERGAALIHLAVLAAAAGFAAWLFAARGSTPGLPQRGLLLLMFAWLWWLGSCGGTTGLRNGPGRKDLQP
jgi:Protein of unknown function (DUF998)